MSITGDKWLAANAHLLDPQLVADLKNPKYAPLPAITCKPDRDDMLSRLVSSEEAESRWEHLRAAPQAQDLSVAQESALAALDVVYRNTIRLAIEGMSQRQIAAIEGVTQGAICHRLNGIRRMLRHLCKFTRHPWEAVIDSLPWRHNGMTVSGIRVIQGDLLHMHLVDCVPQIDVARHFGIKQAAVAWVMRRFRRDLARRHDEESLALIPVRACLFGQPRSIKSKIGC